MPPAREGDIFFARSQLKMRQDGLVDYDLLDPLKYACEHFGTRTASVEGTLTRTYQVRRPILPAHIALAWW